MCTLTMKWNSLSSCMLFLAALAYVRGIQSCKSTSTSGTHFMIGIPESYHKPNYISLHITSTNVTNVRVIAPSISFDTTFKCNMHLIVNMPSRLMLDSPEVIHKNGIKIMSDDACSVTVLSHHGNDGSEGFMALPANGLSTQYIVSSYMPDSHGQSEFLIVAPENFTKIEMMLKYGYHVTKRNVTLNEFDTYMYQSSNDISSSVIRSDKPVAVLSGSSSSKIPDGQGDYQYIVEQMIPEVFLAKTFIIPPIYPRTNYMFRVFPIVDRTTLLLHKGYTNQTDILRNTSTYEYTQSYPTVLIADHPISVMQYGYDTDNFYGDPFMTTVQAISQFQSSYEFISDFGTMGSGSGIWDATLVVTAENSDLPEIQLDSVALQKHPHHKETVRPPFANYSIIYVNITHENMNEFHYLRHTKGRPFGASLYSLPGGAAAYGYPLKFALKDEECQVQTTSTTTTTTSTTTTTTTTTTATTTTTTTTQPTTIPTTKPTTTTTPLPTTTFTLASTSASTTKAASTPEQAITIFTTTATHSNMTSSMQCFSCRDIPHLKYCDKVVTCSENEVCYVESYMKSPETVLYKTGCVNQEVCNIPTGPNECLQCCDSSSFCNVEGCGDSGVTGLSRGPYCYDCTHIGETENCRSVQMCPSDQVCMIEKYAWGDNDYNYIMGCIHPHVCEVRKRSMDYINPYRKLAPRHVPECTHCCSSDFCNSNCTRHHIQEIVGNFFCKCSIITCSKDFKS